MSKLEDLVSRYGANPDSLLRFDDDDERLLPYATLVSARRAGSEDLRALYAAYEWQDNPLILLVDGDQVDDEGLQRIRRRVALAGTAPYLGVLSPGRLTIHAVGLDGLAPNDTRVPIAASEPLTFAVLAAERPFPATVQRQWIADVILRLLRDSLRDLHASGIDETDAISLAGRALFTRFLADRGLLPKTLDTGDDHRSLFDTPRDAHRTSQWLDDTFNGDFLPLSARLWDVLPHAACLTLGHILRRAPGGQLYLGWDQKWDFLDFSQIPVGVLSQAYEGYLREHQPRRQRKQGGYYTPRPIAELMVRSAFHALNREGCAHQARVLDPAVGGGIFLITAFRQLVAERWRATGHRPDSAVLREILYGQLTGFDIDEAALRFAALGLYLIAIELDPKPEPVDKLRFENLRDRVLWKVGDIEHPARRLGSLGSAVGAEHSNRYDLVIGNPPWTGAGRIPGWDHVKGRVARIARDRLGDAYPAPPIPNEVPDLPFLWLAMEWGRPGAHIALALHARLLFQQGDGMPEARNAIFSALDVTGVINGADLRKTEVWPQVAAPFCLLFARNSTPPSGAGFRLLSPRFERSLNGAGIMRLDPDSAEPIGVEQLIARPTVLKTLFRGSRLDLELLERIESRELPTLDRYWRQLFGERRGKARQSGNGYQRLRRSTQVPQTTTPFLGWPDVSRLGPLPVSLDTRFLPRFAEPALHRMRNQEIYRGPLLLVHESPPADTSRIRASVSDCDILFNESFFGYSAYDHPEPQKLVRYLALVLGSRFTVWHALMTSGKFGFERDTIEKSTIDGTPLVPMEDLSHADRERIDPLFTALVAENDEAHWREVDHWVGSLLGLREKDTQVIADTLAYRLPFALNQNLAQQPPLTRAVDEFRHTLQKSLQPWCIRLDRNLSLLPAEAIPQDCPWQLLWLGLTGSPTEEHGRPTRDQWQGIVHIADRIGAAEILHRDPSGPGLWMARLRQARYWTTSQARLLAQHIVWEHLDFLLGEGTS